MFTKLGIHGVAMVQFGDKVRVLRRRKSLTVRRLAEKVGRTPGYVSRIETRNEIPSPELTCALADVLGVSPESLLTMAKQEIVERTSKEVSRRHAEALTFYRKTL